MKIGTLRRLVGASLLLPALACAQQSGQGGWWDQAKSTGQAQDVHPAAADTGQASAAAAPEPSIPVPPAGPFDAATLAGFDCVEVRRFEIGGGFIGTKEDARAATIPAAHLQNIQRRVAGYVPEKARGLKSTLVSEGWPACPEPSRALVLGGRITDYKEGNQALRYLVGFGAGAQKFSVEVWLARKSDGALVARDAVVDRKVCGWIGGQADKGMDDFAEKVAGFVRDSLRSGRAGS